VLDRCGLAGRNTGQRRLIIRRFAGAARVLEFSFCIVINQRNRFLAKRVIRVFVYDCENIGGTGGNTIPTAIAFIRIDCDKIFATAILISIISKHDVILSLLFI
jgi:hypothetical protein